MKKIHNAFKLITVFVCHCITSLYTWLKQFSLLLLKLIICQQIYCN